MICNSWLIILFAHKYHQPLILLPEKSSSEEHISNSEAPQVGHVKGVFTKMHLRSGNESFPDKQQILNLSIMLQCQLTEPLAFWDLAHEEGALWNCLDTLLIILSNSEPK